MLGQLFLTEPLKSLVVFKAFPELIGYGSPLSSAWNADQTQKGMGLDNDDP